MGSLSPTCMPTRKTSGCSLERVGVILNGSGQLLPRVLVVLAAICLVVAFTLALLLPPFTELGRVISMANHGVLVALQDVVRGHVSVWLWDYVFAPFLARPAWMVPLFMGAVLGGTALTLSSRRGVKGSPRWRN